jgi:hypothetical protein
MEPMLKCSVCLLFFSLICACGTDDGEDETAEDAVGICVNFDEAANSDVCSIAKESECTEGEWDEGTCEDLGMSIDCGNGVFIEPGDLCPDGSDAPQACIYENVDAAIEVCVEGMTADECTVIEESELMSGNCADIDFTVDCGEDVWVETGCDCP